MTMSVVKLQHDLNCNLQNILSFSKWTWLPLGYEPIPTFLWSEHVCHLNEYFWMDTMVVAGRLELSLQDLTKHYWWGVFPYFLWFWLVLRGPPTPPSSPFSIVSSTFSVSLALQWGEWSSIVGHTYWKSKLHLMVGPTSIGANIRSSPPKGNAFILNGCGVSHHVSVSEKHRGVRLLLCIMISFPPSEYTFIMTW